MRIAPVLLSIAGVALGGASLVFGHERCVGCERRGDKDGGRVRVPSGWTHRERDFITHGSPSGGQAAVTRAVTTVVRANPLEYVSYPGDFRSEYSVAA
jgi:hypothetical protein